MTFCKKLIAALLLASSGCLSAVADGASGVFEKNVAVDFSKVEITDSFWSPKLKAHATNTLPSCLSYCTTKTGRVDNFMIAAGIKTGQFRGIFFDDSDLYKMIEGIAYSLQNNKNPQMEQEVDTIISYIAQAQQDDGYINTYYQVAHPDKKWTDMSMHEMYCGGHMIEAGIAYYNATGKRSLLDVAIKFADYLCRNFGPGKKDWVPGHQEIELALVKLYRATQNKEYLNLARFLLEERGRGKGVWSIQNKGYFMDETPASDVKKITGHAVRAMYQMTGMADYAAATADTLYLQALQRAWNDLTQTKMYITGGIGSSTHNEGFEDDYWLPNKEAYCETCASIGMVFWNQRMNSLFGDGKFLDIMEKCIYNGTLAGISLGADLFFYVNPLASDGNHHRKPWYGTACCPSNVSRFMPSIGGYIYATSPGELWVNTYIGSKASISIDGTDIGVSMQTNYPWEGKSIIQLTPAKAKRFTMKLHIPGWCKDYDILVNGKTAKHTVENGYALLDRKWKKGDCVTINLQMPVMVQQADERVEADRGRRAIQRGPIIYCLEEIDNPNISTAELAPDAEYTPHFDSELLGGCTTISTTDANGNKLKFIPYHLWDNRQAGKMEVWIKTR